MTITDETVRYAAALAKLYLNDEEALKAREDLQQIIGYMDILNELDTEMVAPMTHVFPLENVFREDEVQCFAGGREALLANASQKKDGCFQAPKTVE